MPVQSFSNSVVVGRIAKDPTMSTTQRGNSMASFEVVLTRRVGDTEVTSFIPVIAYAKQADVVAQLFLKGTSVLVAGRLEKSKADRNIILVADNVQLLLKA
jgi:single-stranded DNA-binding protein